MLRTKVTALLVRGLKAEKTGPAEGRWPPRKPVFRSRARRLAAVSHRRAPTGQPAPSPHPLSAVFAFLSMRYREIVIPMRAAILNAPGSISLSPLEIAQAPQPELRPGHVLRRVRACGACRTDLHIVEGELPPRKQPLIPGHQIVGEITDGHTPALPLGTRVGVSWIGGTDGTCRD